MSRDRSRSGGSSRPSLLGSDGSIDLTGGLGGGLPGTADAPSGESRGDAWVADRERRSMMPRSKPVSALEMEPSQESLPRDLIREMTERFELGDYAGALSVAELQLGIDPTDDSARRHAVESRRRLEARYTARIGSLRHVFNCALPDAKLRWLGLDPQAAFLLTLVDGQTSVQEVLDLCPLARLEALRLFTELLEAQAIVRVG
ncbi:MAG: hypothetical protein PVH21_00125 [Myxococcales bacterium]|jgi:hypothetical protein